MLNGMHRTQYDRAESLVDIAAEFRICHLIWDSEQLAGLTAQRSEERTSPVLTVLSPNFPAKGGYVQGISPFPPGVTSLSGGSVREIDPP